MILPDVNVLIYAFREGAPGHQEYKAWLGEVLAGDQAYAMSDIVLSGFLRVTTNPAIFDPAVPLQAALDFVQEVRSPPHCVPVIPGTDHWDIFVKLCRKTAARGNHVADAYLAALAIESGNELLTTDRDFSRYPGLRWRHPLQS